MPNEETEKKEIDATPTKDLFISILVRDVTLKDAIGDLLDNSVDGARRLRGRESYEDLWVKITLDAEEGQFVIKDNCGGIPVPTARQYAFRFGKPEEAESIDYSVGVFGIGMKRALFRLGDKFRVESTAENSRFEMEVDVDKWKKQKDEDGQASWAFEFDDYQENLDEEFPENERGTTITVTQLHSSVLESFGLENDVNELIQELQHEHMYTINKGLDILVNEVLLEAPELELLESDDLTTAYWEDLSGPVEVRLYAGISDKDKNVGGWYVFCNRRLVLGPDQTKTTGWGTERITRIPEYHSQFYRCSKFCQVAYVNNGIAKWDRDTHERRLCPSAPL